MKLIDETLSWKHVLSLLQITVDSNLSYKKGRLSLWWCKQLCKDYKIRVDFSSLLNQVFGYIQLSAMEIIHSESIKMLSHLSYVF